MSRLVSVSDANHDFEDWEFVDVTVPNASGTIARSPRFPLAITTFSI